MKVFIKILSTIFVLFIIFCLIIAVEVQLARLGPRENFKNPERTERVFGTGEKLTYLVLGDSTAAGQGGDYERGIAVHSAEYIGKNREVHMINFAISGAIISDVLRKQIPDAKDITPDVVLVSVGANDVTHLTSLNSISNDLDQIISTLRARNPNVQIILTGAADMGAVPRLAQPLRAIAGFQTNRINKVFTKIIKDKNVTFASIAAETGPIFRKDRTNFSSDNFHPNNKGYEVWNVALEKAINKLNLKI